MQIILLINHQLVFHICRLVLLIRLVMYQYGYVADVPIWLYSQNVEMTAYFGWRVASVCCFSNAELSYLQVLFELPLPSLIRDYQQARLQVEVDEGDDYYVYDPIGEDGRRIFLDGRPEERNYTPVERQQFLLELQGVGRSETLSSRLLN